MPVFPRITQIVQIFDLSTYAIAIGNWMFDPVTDLERTRLLLSDLKFAVAGDGNIPTGPVLSILGELGEELNGDSGVALLNRLGQFDVKKITRPAVTSAKTFADKLGLAEVISKLPIKSATEKDKTAKGEAGPTNAK